MHLIYFVNSLAKAIYIDSRHKSILFTLDQETIGKFARQPSYTRIGSASCTLFFDLKNQIVHNRIGIRINSFTNLSIAEIYFLNTHLPDFVIVPMIKNVFDIQNLRQILDPAIEIIPLIETCSSLVDLPRIVACSFINRVHLGINDLSIELGLGFMFNFLLSPAFDWYSDICSQNKVSFGFGGVSAPLSDATAALKPFHIITEHARIGSDCCIISRNFESLEGEAISDNIIEIRRLYSSLLTESSSFFYKSRQNLSNLLSNLD